VTEADLKARLKDSLSSFKVPKRIEFYEFEDIPRTESGKIRKHQLREMMA